AKGETAPAQCSGGRHWIQLVYDAWLLEQADLSMIDARDAMLAADLMRFGGTDQTLMWHAFAHRGLGAAATSATGDDTEPTPGFGLVKLDRTLAAGTSTLTIALPTNWASAASDATAAGDGVNLGKLIDDDEGTDWASLSGAVKGKTVTVDLDGRHVLTAARVS